MEGSTNTMEWGHNVRKQTQEQLRELDSRLEVVALATEVGIDEAVRRIAQRCPDLQINPDTIRVWVQECDRAHALALGSLKVAERGRN